MTFINAVRSCFKNYANFNGRASRSEYWWFSLFNGLVFMALLILSFIAYAALGLGERFEGPMIFFVLACMAWGVAILVPSIAVCARRLHDTNKSGWLQLLHFVPFGNWILLIICCFEGDRGPNVYGERSE